MNISLRRNL